MSPAKKTSESTASRPVLLLLDGHSLAYRAYYALKEADLRTTTGQPTGAVQGFTSMLINTLRDERPTHVAVAFDVSRQTFRTEKFPEYKANRSASPDDFKSQVGLIDELLAGLGITVIRKEGFEADDVIATLTTQAAADGYEVRILTGDRDSLQLVTENVTVLYPKRGVSDLSRFTPAAVEEKYELTPQQYPDFAALRGDPSDNLPNIPGVGEKTAAKWIREFGSLTELIERADEVKGKAGETLRAHLEQVRLNRELTELIKDVPLPAGPPDLAWASEGNPEAVYQLFDTLEFSRSMRDRVAPLLASDADDSPVGEAVALQGQVLEVGQLADWLAANATGEGATGVSVHGSWGRGTGDVSGLAFATADGTAAYVDATQLDPADETALAAWLADPARQKILHDAKGPSLALAARGFTLAGVAADTALEAYLAQSGRRSFDLEPLAEEVLGRRLSPAGADENQGTLFADEDAEAERQMAAAHAVLDLADALRGKLAETGAEQLLTDIELPLVGVLAEMEQVGIAIDERLFQDLEKGFSGEAAKEVDAARAEAGVETLNLGSPKQLQEVLFENLGMPKTKKIKTGYTTDADSLAWLQAQTQHPFLDHLLRWREVNRLKTVVEGLSKSVSPDTRIHTTYNQMIAATGRLSSVDPNLQNIPIRTLEGQQIRKAFIAGPGYESLMTADYSQIEMRIMAHLSEDAGLIEAFTSGEDLHNTVAAKVFDVEATAVEPEHRRRIKAMSYGLAYGLSAFGLSQQLGIETGEAAKMMEDYFQRFGGVRDYLHDLVVQARATGYTETMFGRRRYLPDLASDNRQRREMAERMALNAPIQGSAADIIKVAMIRVREGLREQQLKSRMLLQVHDELVLEIAPGEAPRVEELVRREMGSAAELRVPLDVSVGMAENWADAAH
ncbi:DNA polymerase I [Catenulispora acidiphila DSM 44928]|uniref:DNA polymerase I n=1 Tax=Catenulispora acidiphila (strain DSM 44928 / JCM 14897 / NBRC 102108 / NRRL B-24433 / ID139908) TaxID=479433 RepID=C7QC87_CATAD|nr:DNA polymerase I [Catenulispora acidiphila]ACU74535.1 DNA polymerase I [Catenulispora acidiphila DSM 44928]